MVKHITIIGAALAASVGTACYLGTAAPARAGMTDQETGETCWGEGCLDGGENPPSTGGGSSTSALPSNVTTEDCSGIDTQRIGFAIEWLRDNLPLIDAKMGQSVHLMSWPGNSRENFEQKLGKRLKIFCINQKSKCDDGLRGIAYPIVAQKRVNLCSRNLNDAAGGDTFEAHAHYIRTVAHEIGHLVRLNGHDGNCWERFEDPGFSDSLGFSAEYAFRDEPYDPDIYTSGCGGGTKPVVITDKFGNEVPIQAEK